MNIEKYNLTFTEDPESGGFTVLCQEIPEAVAQGEDKAEAFKNLLRVIDILEEHQNSEKENFNRELFLEDYATMCNRAKTRCLQLVNTFTDASDKISVEEVVHTHVDFDEDGVTCNFKIRRQADYQFLERAYSCSWDELHMTNLEWEKHVQSLDNPYI